MQNFKIINSRLLLTSFLLLYFHIFVFATTYTMKCIAFSPVNWSNPESWEPTGVPGAGDDVIINCPASSYVVTNGDITVKSLTIYKTGYIFGPGVLKVTERIDTRYPFFWQMQLNIGPNATGLITNELSDQDTQGIIFYENLTVDGSLTLESREFKGTNVTINGSLTQKEGGIKANIVVNASGILNIESPIYYVELGTVMNKGTINWKKGKIIAGWGTFTNDGILNIDSRNATFEYNGFFSDFHFKNSGMMNLSSNVDSLQLVSKLVSSGSINLSGPSKLNLVILDLSGSINGVVGSSLYLNGNNSNLESNFRTGSLVNVSSFNTYQTSILNIRHGSNISEIKNFNFGRGSLNAEVAFPTASTYLISADIQTNVDQSFDGSFILEGGSIDGDVTVSFNTSNLMMNSGYFGGLTKVELSAATVLEVTQLGVSDLVNDGIINVRSGGYLSTSSPGILNSGTINTTGERVSLLGYNNNADESILNNKGTINLNSKLNIFSIKLENTGSLNIGGSDTLSFFGELQQKGMISGQSGSKLSLGYGSNSHTFNAGSITKNLNELEIFYGSANFKSGSILENLVTIRATSGLLQSSIIMPPAFKYLFKDSKIRLNSLFEPANVFESEDTDFEGSGNIRINGLFNWFGGILDVPIRINDNASVFIRENLTRPIISAPFTNTGNITLSGGIIEINTGFFKNSGVWNIDSDEDVIIDGYTTFNNQGIFSICGDQPIKLIFNVPFLNSASGTFKGQGSYTFNAGFINEGTVAPGCSPGRLLIEDDAEFITNVEIEVDGQEVGEFDELIVNGDMKAGNLLKVIVPNSTVINESLKIIHTTGTFTGKFAQVEMPNKYTLIYVSDGVLLSSNETVDVIDQNVDTGTISISPTVTQSYIELHTDQILPYDSNVSLFNVQGEQVLTQSWPNNEPVLQMFVDHLSNGVYIIKINTLSSWTGKIVVVH